MLKDPLSQFHLKGAVVFLACILAGGLSPAYAQLGQSELITPGGGLSGWMKSKGKKSKTRTIQIESSDGVGLSPLMPGSGTDFQPAFDTESAGFQPAFNPMQQMSPAGSAGFQPAFSAGSGFQPQFNSGNASFQPQFNTGNAGFQPQFNQNGCSHVASPHQISCSHSHNACSHGCNHVISSCSHAMPQCMHSHSGCNHSQPQADIGQTLATGVTTVIGAATALELIKTQVGPVLRGMGVDNRFHTYGSCSSGTFYAPGGLP